MASDDLDPFNLDEWNETEWESVEGIELYFDSDGTADLFMVINGELIDYGTLDPSEVEQYIWEDLYYWAQDYDIPFEVEADYA